MKSLFVLALAAVPLVACSVFDPSYGKLRGGHDGDDPNADQTKQAAVPACTVFGKPHIGLGGVDVASQGPGPKGRDRMRAKPYSALATEFSRVLGEENKPDSLDDAKETFGVNPDMWFSEPLATAAYVNTAYDVAFDGCLKLTANSRYQTAPTSASATAECTDWIRKFWSRDGSPDEIASCTKTAVEATTETYGTESRAVTPARQWAYACAATLSATGFLTY